MEKVRGGTKDEIPSYVGQDEEDLDFLELLKTIGKLQTPARDIANFLRSAMVRRKEAHEEQIGQIPRAKVLVNLSDLELINAYQRRFIERDRIRESCREKESHERTSENEG